MAFDTWLFFCITEAVLSFTPGPAVLLVISIALTRGARDGLLASLGILAANAIYFVLSATAIGAILVASWEVFFLIKWLGAAYLVWLGLRMLLSRSEAAAADRILAVSSISIEFLILSLYVAACHRARGMMRRPGFATALNRAGGVLLIGAAAGMATLKR